MEHYYTNLETTAEKSCTENAEPGCSHTNGIRRKAGGINKNSFLTSLLFAIMLMMAVPFSASAQFCTQDPIPSDQLDLRGNSEYTAGQCPANDIVILGASLDTGDACNSCAPGTTVTADLLITINHGTNSGNRYLGVFADLTETLPDGTIQTCEVARCSGPVAKDSEETGDQQVLNYGQVTFTCGSSLQLSDILLVWTAANGECPVTPANNPNGKYCYDNPIIDIVPPLNAVVEAECGDGNKGNYDLTVTGGVGPFTYLW
ncbi:SprB repeat-containing protein, partial [uncultured Eudoraea sp.]|uniref:SprB repeat-containing protein n=1 Tax=uncultured Eudoraea sp. TaxID=1035614 RepID=UPI0026126373